MTQKRKKIVITGAGGFLGSAIYAKLSNSFDLRLVDVKGIESRPNAFKGDICDYDFCLDACKEADALVLSHMSSWPYDTPVNPFDINVKGTANMFFAANMAGIKEICLISSFQAVRGHGSNYHASANRRPLGCDIYSTTKACQEVVAESFHKAFNINTSVLRVGYVIDGLTMQDKYGTQLNSIKEGMIDRYDIAEAVKIILSSNHKGYKVLTLDAGIDPQQSKELAEAYQFLQWQPKYCSNAQEIYSCI